MKCQASISVNKELLLQIKEKVGEGCFRNQSHFFEFAAKRFLDQNKNQNSGQNINKNQDTFQEDRK